MTTPESSPPPRETPQPPSIPPRSQWPFAVMWMVIVFLVMASGVYVFKSCRDLPGDTLDRSQRLAGEVGHQLEKVAAAFKQGTVTTTFTSYATTISGSQNLQFATLSQQEMFTRTDESSMAFGYIPLPDVIVQASAPVSYTYYLDLNDRWDFKLQNGVIFVIAPKIKYNRPAVDVSRITYEVKKNSLIRNTTEAMDNLKSSITALSYKKAEENVPLVRETGRRQTELFVHNWLSKSFADGKKYPVQVVFRNELGRDGNLLTPKPETP